MFSSPAFSGSSILTPTADWPRGAFFSSLLRYWMNASTSTSPMLVIGEPFVKASKPSPPPSRKVEPAMM